MQSNDPPRLALYANTGSTLHHYDVDVEGAALARRGAIALPAAGQYAWPHPRLPCLYVACSDGSPGASGGTHCVVALHTDPVTGALRAHGQPVALPSRPIHITTDIEGKHVLIAYNNPSGLTVHRIGEDGAVGAQVKQQATLDAGIFAHQVRVMPSNETVILVTRGNNAADQRPEDPGALKVFGFRDGQLTNKASIAPNGGYGFGPRHLDFHPAQPLVYVSLERQNQIHVYGSRDDAVDEAPVFSVHTRTGPRIAGVYQRAGTIHAHPRGHVVYAANRASGTTMFEGAAVHAGGENSIAVFAPDPATGEPELVQHIDTRGFVPRTFAIDPGGRLLVVANAQASAVREGSGVANVPPNLAVFRIAADGKLTYVAKHDIETGGATLFWMGIVALGQHA